MPCSKCHSDIHRADECPADDDYERNGGIPRPGNIGQFAAQLTLNAMMPA